MTLRRRRCFHSSSCSLHTPFAVLPALHNLGHREHVALTAFLYSCSQLLLRCKKSVARTSLFFPFLPVTYNMCEHCFKWHITVSCKVAIIFLQQHPISKGKPNEPVGWRLPLSLKILRGSCMLLSYQSSLSLRCLPSSSGCGPGN